MECWWKIYSPTFDSVGQLFSIKDTRFHFIVYHYMLQIYLYKHEKLI